MSKVLDFILGFFKFILYVIGSIILFAIVVILLPIMIPYALIEYEKEGHTPIKGVDDDEYGKEAK